MAKLGELGVETSTGVVKLPFYDEGDSGSNVYEYWKVYDGASVGFVPLVDPADASIPEVKMNTSIGILAANASPTLATLTVISVLNSDTVILYGYEDTTGDGTAENTDSWTLTGGTESLSVSAFDLSTGNEFWFEVDAEDDGTITNAVEQIEVSLEY